MNVKINTIWKVKSETTEGKLAPLALWSYNTQNSLQTSSALIIFEAVDPRGGGEKG